MSDKKNRIDSQESKVKISYSGITSYEKLQKNPFIKELYEIEVSSKKKILAGNKPSVIVDTQTGEVQGHQVFAIRQKVDTESFTKLFGGMMKELFNLSQRGVRVFSFITSITKPNKDVIFFDMDDAKEYTKYKNDQSILHGLEELLKHNIIARSNKHYKYYINPNMFFNGNRLTLINEYIKEVPKLRIDKPKKQI